MEQNNEFLNELFDLLPDIYQQHSPLNKIHSFLLNITSRFIADAFNKGDSIVLGPYENIIFPYQAMGNISSINLFELDELIIFAFYWHNKARYKNVLDLGANLGLHSILLSKCGYKVNAFEPVPLHYQALKENIKNNCCKNITTHQAAVSTHTNGTEFLLVKGNTTGSHIVGSKKNPYGELETLKVNTVTFNSIVENIDLIKMDVEGHESTIILESPPTMWENTDLMLSIHDQENAQLIFDYFNQHNIPMYSQKLNWGKVEKIEDMIVTHHDGSLFISKTNKPWL
ncbi:FkbM family methyltransferase [Colwellia sp. UCD-KL20]|uniref:FkbM family methyltransferase n=1 Tax=Colwellia sp. UCD-KL20 TaxID=1917165 RepID=UPI000970A633|nr:FkbM family methyltransferase [Colwellia sp. UCD-KL20]